MEDAPAIKQPPARPVPSVPLAVAAGASQSDQMGDWGATRCLIAATAVAGLGGIPLGFYLAFVSATGGMANIPWVGLVQAHGQLQMFGWLGLTVLGVTFHAMAHLFDADEPPARIATTVLLLQLAGVALRLLAPIVPGAAGAGGAWFLLGSALAFAGAFAVTLEAHVRTMSRRRGAPRAPAILPRFLLVGLGFWFAALLVNLDGAIDAVRFGPAAAGAISAGRDAVVVAAVTGGLAMVALGMSLRVIVGWLDLSRPDLGRAQQAWLPLLLAISCRVLGQALAGTAPLAASVAQAVGGICWAYGVFVYVPALRGLWARSAVTARGGASGEADPPLAWFVRTAYAWLVVSAALALFEAALVAGKAAGLAGVDALDGAAVADAGRHAILFGFLGLLTAGLTGRLPTAFLEVGAPGIAATRGTYRAAWLCLVAASALRVTAPLTGDARAALIAGAGICGSAGLCCLLAVLLRIAALAAARHRRLARFRAA